jgi:diguanylate cyclase (GGDEF)-like protein/PAS domain S-box-containing protein
MYSSIKGRAPQVDTAHVGGRSCRYKHDDGLSASLAATLRRRERSMPGSRGGSPPRIKTPLIGDLSARLRASEQVIAEQRTQLRLQESLLLVAQEHSARLTATADCSAEAMYSSREGRITSWNRGAEALYGYSAAEVTGLPVQILYPAGRGPELADITVRMERGETIAPHRTVRRRKDGSFVQVSLSLSPILNEEGKLCGTAAVGRDLSEDDRLLDELQESESRYRSIVESAQEGIGLIDLAGKFTFVNRRMGELLGLAVERLVGANAFELIDIESATTVRTRLAERQSGTAGQYEVSSLRPDGSIVRLLVSAAPQFDSDGAYAGSLCMVSDLSGLRRAEEELAHQALHDPLTGLPNRALLYDRVDRALARNVLGPPAVAILFCDLDGFKDVNDLYGRHVGDQLLRLLSDRLVAAVSPNDTVARLEADEFIVLVEDLTDASAAMALAARLRAIVAEPIQAGGAEAVVTCSVGVAMAPAEDASTLLHQADTAMCRAKDDGRNRAVLFDERLRDVTMDRLGLWADLRHAVGRGQLRLHYQPIVALEGERLAGVEALVRWQHPQRGLVMPDEFIGLAESRGLIVDIGNWVLREACRQAALWVKAGPGGTALNMAVNVSALQLAPSAGLVDTIADVLRESGVDPSVLVLEITENALMGDAEAALGILSELKALGINLAIDDFGTGYSSLMYLKRFPVDVLKVDRSFVSGLGRDLEDSAIVASVIGLARAVGIVAVAEGVETAEQLAALQELGCEYGQGYLWSRPVPAAELKLCRLGHVPSLRPSRRAAVGQLSPFKE